MHEAENSPLNDLFHYHPLVPGPYFPFELPGPLVCAPRSWVCLVHSKIQAMNPQAIKNSRRLYIGGIPETTSEVRLLLLLLGIAHHGEPPMGTGHTSGSSWGGEGGPQLALPLQKVGRIAASGHISPSKWPSPFGREVPGWKGLVPQEGSPSHLLHIAVTRRLCHTWTVTPAGCPL